MSLFSKWYLNEFKEWLGAEVKRMIKLNIFDYHRYEGTCLWSVGTFSKCWKTKGRYEQIFPWKSEIFLLRGEGLRKELEEGGSKDFLNPPRFFYNQKIEICPQIIDKYPMSNPYPYIWVIGSNSRSKYKVNTIWSSK